MPAVADEELSETGEFLDGVAAIVNEGVVLKSALRTQVEVIRAQLEPQGVPLPPPDIFEEQVLERLIMEEVQLQRADRMGLEIPDQMVNDAIERIAVANDTTLEELPEKLAAENVDYAEFREDMRKQITLDQLRRIDVGQRIQVSPREIEACIADLEDNVVVNSDWNLSHILLQLPEAPSAADIEATSALANSIYEQLQEGTDFRELAVRHSNGSTALEGGALGWFEGENVPTLFIDILPGMTAGDFSRPFRNSSSFHIVRVEDVRSDIERSEEKQVKARHILITPNELIDDATAQQQLNEAVERIDNGEDFGEVAKLMSDDTGSAPLGGDLGWAGPEVFVPEFQAEIDKLEIGGRSQPFRSRYGWHVVEVLDRRVYDNTEEVKQQNCVGRIRASKLDEETQLWLRRLRDEAFVDIRI